MNEPKKTGDTNNRNSFFVKKGSEGQVWGGVFLLLIGIAALVRNFVPDLNWLFSWPMFLIALGIFIGLKNNFEGPSWLILIIVGGYFLTTRYFRIDHEIRRLLWPFALIALGAYLVFRPKKRANINRNFPVDPMDSGEKVNPNAGPDTLTDTNVANSTTSSNMAWAEEEVLDVASVFSGVKKNIYSKNFKGGEIVCVFGGAEINLTQADFQPPQIIIESVQVFGGAKLIVPSDWVIHNEATAIFGGIEDKRPQPASIRFPEKVLVLKGFVMFGGIEIKSY